MLRHGWLTPVVGEEAKEEGDKGSCFKPTLFISTDGVSGIVCLPVHRFVPGGCCETPIKTDRQTITHTSDTHTFGSMNKNDHKTFGVFYLTVNKN